MEMFVGFRIFRATSTWNRYSETGTNGGNVYNNPFIVATSSTYWVREYYLMINPWVEWTLTRNNPENRQTIGLCELWHVLWR